MFLSIQKILPQIVSSLYETFIMVSISSVIAIIIGGIIAFILYLNKNPKTFIGYLSIFILNFLVNSVRSIPFVILTVILIPLTRFVLGTSIGPFAASLALSVAAIPFFARMLETTLKDIPMGVIEAGNAMGASKYQLIYKILLREARSGIVLNITTLIINILSYSAVSGLVGGGGLGDLAIRKGYQDFNTEIMFSVVFIIVTLVHIIQWSGTKISLILDKRIQHEL